MTAYFARYGISRIELLINDNARVYRWSLRAVCAEGGVPQKIIKPHCPWQEGKVERLNRTLATQWAAVHHDEDALASWIEHDDIRCRHSGLGGKPRPGD